MVRYRKIKKWGNTFVIVLKMADVFDLNLKEGDNIDVEDALINRSISDEILEDQSK